MFLFNDALNTFYLQLYVVRHMVKDHSDSERGNRSRHIGFSIRLATRVLLYASFHREDNTYHGTLVGTKNGLFRSWQPLVVESMQVFPAYVLPSWRCRVLCTANPFLLFRHYVKRLAVRLITTVLFFGVLCRCRWFRLKWRHKYSKFNNFCNTGSSRKCAAVAVIAFDLRGSLPLGCYSARAD